MRTTDSWLFTMEHFSTRAVARIATLLIIVCVLVDAGYAQSTRARVARAVSKYACELPPQPLNGRWKLHPVHCTDQEECDVESGTTELPLGSRLVYSCNAGYKMTGSADVSCSIGGNWLAIPVCTVISCKGLSTASVDATCRYDARWVPCVNPILPGTTAALLCRNSYRPEFGGPFDQGNDVTCNDNGVWEPEPLRCVPECGLLPSDLISLSSDSFRPNTAVFPWHASIYRDYPGQPKRFLCGATIIQENLVITAAHCVYDTTSKGPVDASKLHVTTGNIYHDYDSILHNDAVVKRTKVKNIYIECNYEGFDGNFGSDIAILELVEPFVLSASLLPACIDLHVDDQLVPNVYGKMAGFGRNSTILQSLRLLYIPHSQCKSASENVGMEHYITPDKFCADYLNGSSVCQSDSGSGLVFQSNGRWSLRGILSVSLGAKNKEAGSQCDSYVLFTRLSRYIEWIQEIVINLGLNRPSCFHKS